MAISHGDGAYLFDVDGNRYVDLVGGLGPVILGYSDPDINEAIRRQLDDGISFSLPSILEGELAELLCKHIPCAEMVKFGKSGTDVTTAAVRLARAYTGRKHIGVGGYHGWADWSMACTDKSLGIPDELKDLSNRISEIEYPTSFAAIIVEPNENKDLKEIRELCDRHGVVLIFDEILTGFRYDLGGAQKLYGVTPDLACFGKAMANGMPISALVGRKHIMNKFNDPKLHYSGTFFGDALSIAAAIATIKKIESHRVIDHLELCASISNRGFAEAKVKHGLTGEIELSGQQSHQTLKFKDDKIRSLFMQEMIQNGVLIINRPTFSFAHKMPELNRVVTAYDNTFKTIRAAIDDGSITNVTPIAAPPLRAA